MVGMYPCVHDTLELAAQRVPDRAAVIAPHSGTRLTYAELDERATRLADALGQLGVEKGDRVSTVLYNGPEQVLTLFACAKRGAIFNPINYRFQPEQVAEVLADAGGSVVVIEAETRDRLSAIDGADSEPEHVLYAGPDTPPQARQFQETVESGRAQSPDVAVARDDAYGLLYTSGTTGRPKGVLHEHGSIVEHSLILAAEGGARREDVGLISFPLFHAAELHGSLIPRIHVGATNVLFREFAPGRVLEAIEEYEATVMFAPPTGWHALLEAKTDHQADVSSLSRAIYGAAPMPETVLNRAMHVFDTGFLQAYGMTELGPAATFLHPEDHPEKAASAGLPALNHEVRVVDVEGAPGDRVPTGQRGEIVIAGPCSMREYWNRTEATEATFEELDGVEWYRTGDIGYRDPEGYLHVVDRKDDRIITGGENVYPTPIEDVLHGHPGVSHAAVVGEADEKWGQRVVAYVVGDVSAEALDRHVRESGAVADYERPRRYYFVADLPMNATGKVEKHKLRSGEADLDPEVVEV